MRKAGKRQGRKSIEVDGIVPQIPDPSNMDALERWFAGQPPSWAIVAASRAALRTLPVLMPVPVSALSAEITLLPAFRATAIARFAATYTYNEKIAFAAAQAARAARPSSIAASSVRYAALAASAANVATPNSIDTLAANAAFAIYDSGAVFEENYKAVRHDLSQLTKSHVIPERLSREPLWPTKSGDGAWIGRSAELRRFGDHWQVWIDWYDELLSGAPPGSERSEAWEMAFTDVSAPLPWHNSAVVVNTEIAARLSRLDETPSTPAKSSKRSKPEKENKKNNAKVDRRSSRQLPQARTEIGKALLRNSIEISFSIEPLLVLIDQKIESLCAERPNSDEAQVARAAAISQHEELRQKLLALRAASSDFLVGAAEEKAVVATTKSFVDGVTAWWTKSHVKICDKTLDAGLFAGCVGVCALAGSGGQLAVAVSAALVGGKPIIDALKALPKKFAKKLDN